MIEVEQKFIVEHSARLRQRLTEMDARSGPAEQHCDTYYNHPARDFAQTGEAFRIRRINDLPLITYKGRRLPGGIKARRELEWRLDPGDPEGNQMQELLGLLGFRRVATVKKRRFPYTSSDCKGEISMMIDEVESLGEFAEIELLVGSEADVEDARCRIASLAELLGLRLSQPNSYLELLLGLV